MADALFRLGTQHSFVVHGHDGTDELSSTNASDVHEIRAEGIQKHIWNPEDFGLKRAALAQLAGGEALDNARITLNILGGEPGAPRDIVILNAALGLLALGRAQTPREAMEMAAHSVDSGKALAILNKLRKKFPAS